MPDIEPDVVDSPVKVGKGPPALMVLEWGKKTWDLFSRRNKPKQGARYCFKCIRFDGKHMYLVLDEL